MGDSPMTRVLTRSGGTPPERQSRSDMGAWSGQLLRDLRNGVAARLPRRRSTTDTRGYASYGRVAHATGASGAALSLAPAWMRTLLRRRSLSVPPLTLPCPLRTGERIATT